MLFCAFYSDSLEPDKYNLSGVEDSDIRQNIALHLKQIPELERNINFERFSQDVKRKVQTAVYAYSFYDAVVDIKEPEDNGLWEITVSLNQPTLVTRVVLTSDLAAIPTGELPKDISDVIARVTSFQDKQLNHSQYESAKSRLRSLAVFYGFFDFNFPLHKLAIVRDEDTGKSTAFIHWIFNFGKRYRFGDVEYLEFKTAEQLVTEVKTFKKDDLFEQSKVSDFSIDLQSTNYFERALARVNAEEAENFQVPIEVILVPKARDKYNFGIGFSTDTGPRFTAEWRRPWVNLDGHSLYSNLFISRPRQSIEMGYRIPLGNPLKDFIDFQIGYKLTDENQTESDTLTATVLRQYGAEKEDEWDFIPFLRYSREGFEQGIDAERFTTQLVTPGVTYSRVRKRGDIFISWGDRQQITLAAGSEQLLSDIDFAKVHAQTKWVREFGIHRFIMRAEAGAIATNDFDRLPSTERFFAGGDQSIRGFGLDEVSDFNRVINDEGKVETELIGGRYLLVGSVEYAYQFAESWRAAVFYDAGSASNEVAENVAFGYGLGAHWLSPIGTVRLYFARGESEIDRYWRVHLNIGPGL